MNESVDTSKKAIETHTEITCLSDTAPIIVPFLKNLSGIKDREDLPFLSRWLEMDEEEREREVWRVRRLHQRLGNMTVMLERDLKKNKK